MSSANDTFIGIDRQLDNTNEEEPSNAVLEPAELIVSRVVFALLISVSLVMNLLLLLAIIRRRQTVHVIYCLCAAMLVPDLVFYAKLALELIEWGEAKPSWARSDSSCALWQFSTHLYPIMYSVLLCGIVYHAFVTLFLDYSGGYEEKCKRLLPLILGVLYLVTCFATAPSAIYSMERTISDSGNNKLNMKNFRQFCDLSVPSLVTKDDDLITPAVRNEATAVYRLVYELVLPYILPLAFLAFPYVTLLIGLLKSVPAASHSEHSTKMTVVVTLWLLTVYFMFHVSTVLKNVFSILNVWHRLVVMFDAYDDERVPRFQTYIHVLAYALTCLWGVARAGLCFKYNVKLRKALAQTPVSHTNGR